MQINKKQVFILLGILLFAAVIFNFGYKNKLQLTKIEPVKAAHSANVFGWAWADLASGNTERGLGWISFNSKNCDADENGVVDTGMPDCLSNGTLNQYGVTIDQTTGLLSGYGWIGEESAIGSGSVGWISFNQTDLTNCPSGTCEAKMDISTKQLSGWAKIITINGQDSNEGWIHLSGIAQDNSSYGLAIDGSGNINGWAWGSAILGWVSFSCNNFETDNSSCASANYQVTTNITQPSNLTTSLDGGQTQEDYCQESINPPNGADTIQFNWNSIGSDFTLEVDKIQQESGGSGFTDVWTWTGTSTSITERRDVILPGAPSGYYPGSVPPPYGMCGGSTCQFSWRVREGAGDWINSYFRLENHDFPNAQITGPNITQINIPVIYDSSSSVFTQPSQLLWNWPPEFNITSGNSTSTSITGAFTSNGSYQINLTASEVLFPNIFCVTTKNISIMTTPKWKEISP